MLYSLEIQERVSLYETEAKHTGLRSAAFFLVFACN